MFNYALVYSALLLALSACASTELSAIDSKSDQPFCNKGFVPNGLIYIRDSGWSQTHWLVWECGKTKYDSRKIISKILDFAERNDIREIPDNLGANEAYWESDVDYVLQIICLEPIVFFKIPKTRRFQVGARVSRISSAENEATIDIGSAIDYGRVIDTFDRITWYVVGDYQKRGNLTADAYKDWNLDAGWGTLYLEQYDGAWRVVSDVNDR
ncbi:MAG: hypothetical protein AAGG38_07660 [Planctomycetota bacterium]